MLNDLSHWWGEDLSLSASADLLTVSGVTRGQQRILRRLLTNPGDYIFEPDYGAGLPQYIGELLDIPKITTLIRAQLLLEDSVAQSPSPTVTVGPSTTTTDLNAFAVSIAYTDNPSGVATTLAFTVSKTSPTQA